VSESDIPGFRVRTTQRGYRVVELDAWADPARGEAWMAAARKRAASTADFEREVMRNWSITSGATFYPEFGEIGREQYLYESTALLAGPVIRGWDFGWRAPVCVWLQYAPKSDRVYVLREFAPRGISAHHFRDVCRYLSGQLEMTGLDGAAGEWVEMLRDLPGVPTPPWFAPGTAFVDLSGPEVNAVQSISSRDPEEATLRQVWAAGGVEFSVQAGPVKARTTVLRRLLHLRADGRPGILISPACIGVLAMLDGGLTFRKATTLNPQPSEPRKDGTHDNVHDGLTYALVGVVPAEGVPGVTPGMAPWPVEMENIGWTT
jgi:hypothetical protein